MISTEMHYELCVLVCTVYLKLLITSCRWLFATSLVERRESSMVYILLLTRALWNSLHVYDIIRYIYKQIQHHCQM
jgi:hypothetical protein